MNHEISDNVVSSSHESRNRFGNGRRNGNHNTTKTVGKTSSRISLSLRNFLLYPRKLEVLSEKT